MSQYRLVFEENFDVPGLPNPDIWNHEIGGHGWGNGESQYYTDRSVNSYVENGRLVIVAQKEDFEGNHYTSAKLTTKGKFEWKYGRFEIRAKLPKGKGTWPAIWMMPADAKQVGWPRCGEIDIMEHVGKDENQIHVSLHTERYNHRLNTQRTHFEPLDDVCHQFHTYAMEWEDGIITFFYDEKPVQTWRRGENGTDPGEGGWPFDKPFYLILNVALGGFWGGEIDDSILPCTMEIESVKVYQKEKE